MSPTAIKQKQYSNQFNNDFKNGPHQKKKKKKRRSLKQNNVNYEIKLLGNEFPPLAGYVVFGELLNL